MGSKRRNREGTGFTTRLRNQASEPAETDQSQPRRARAGRTSLAYAISC
jgi:hypothetical protein